MFVSGVRSSCDTFATNSRRDCSLRRCSVTSWMTTITPPCSCPEENGAINSSSSRDPAVICASKYCGRRSVRSCSKSALSANTSSKRVVGSRLRESICVAAGL